MRYALGVTALFGVVILLVATFGSTEFLRWIGVELSEEEFKTLTNRGLFAVFVVGAMAYYLDWRKK